MTFWEFLRSLLGGRTPDPVLTPAKLIGTTLVEQHNAFRAAQGRSPLVPHPRLQAAAERHALDMATRGVLSHTGADGSSPFDRMKSAGYVFRSAAENVAAGQPDAAAVVLAWQGDPLHRANLLGPYQHIGAAGARAGDGRVFWCADYGYPAG